MIEFSKKRLFPTLCESGVSLPNEASEALAFILPLSQDYPGIEGWFLTKVVPGLRDGTRFLYRVERSGRLVGLGIAKRTQAEKKICTVRIAPDYVGRGIGLKIFDGLLHWLDTDQPHFTVGEHKLPAFDRIFDWYGFKVTSLNESLYIPQRIELAYNERSIFHDHPSPLLDATKTRHLFPRGKHVVKPQNPLDF
ncbi:GNAT family N-acetyltransferase [Methylobacterium bullatum]|uniref:GNAT family N-acetyltransferase n=1 Tax=Methylobacterium bullatum TaxID=570505 RepID=UPI0030CE53A0